MRVIKVCVIMLIVSLMACQSEVKVSGTFESSVESPFIHTVYFWFKEDVTHLEVKQFAEASKSLAKIEGVLKVYDGTPAATDRPSLEKSYDYALVVLMKDIIAHDAYQQDPIHLKLLSTYSSMFDRILVTDIDK